MSRGDCRIYVGNLPPDIRSKDIEDLFYKFGKIAFVDLKTRRGPPFAFVEFVDSRDAKDAVYSRDGYDYDGYKLRVEFPRGRERGPGGVFKSSNRRRDGPSGSSSSSRRSNYRVKITGLPPTGSWQDLKDHMREAGDVCFADVYKDGSGVVEFLRYEDMRYAVKKLDDTRFRSHEGEVSYIRITEDNGKSPRGRYSRSRSRSRSRSPKRSRGSPTYSPARDDDDDDDDDDDRSRSRDRESRDSRDDSRSPTPAEKNSRQRNGRDSRSYSRSKSGSYPSRSPSREHSDESSERSKSRSKSKD